MNSHLQSLAAISSPVLDAASWAKTGSKFIGFLADFAVFGALGFRLVWQRLPDWSQGVSDSGLATIFRRVDRRAALIGLVGAGLLLGEFGAIVLRSASSVQPEDYAQLILAPLLLIAFWLAAHGRRGAWPAALLLGGALALRTIVTGRWRALINPLHAASASLWLGTLFVMFAAALPVVLREPVPRAVRGPLVASLAARYSPLALYSAALVGLSGLATSWLHLKYFAALWTTPYGQTLIIKLVVVAGIVALGAWNWRRVLPRLGDEKAATALRRSSQWELAFALIVLVVTAVLVSLPSPKLPG